MAHNRKVELWACDFPTLKDFWGINLSKYHFIEKKIIRAIYFPWQSIFNHLMSPQMYIETYYYTGPDVTFLMWIFVTFLINPNRICCNYKMCISRSTYRWCLISKGQSACLEVICNVSLFAVQILWYSAILRHFYYYTLILFKFQSYLLLYWVYFKAVNTVTDFKMNTTNKP